MHSSSDFPLLLAPFAVLPAVDGLTDAAIVAYGDSLTKATGASLASKTYPSAAASRLSTLRIPFNRGIGGQTSTQIAARQGGRDIVVTVSGNSIPASGGIAVTAKSINVLFEAGAYTGTIKGTIAGIPGTMSTNASGDWTFTRTSAGSITAAPAGSLFVIDDAVAFRGYTHWIEAGRNNIPDVATILSDIAAMVAYIGHGRYRVLSILPSTGDGPTILDAIDAANAALKATYGARYVDTLAALKAANDGSPDDLADIAARYTPRSLRSDNLHLNDKGYEVKGIAVAVSYPVSDQAFAPALGVAAAWGEFDAATGWTIGNDWSISGGRLIRGANATGSEVLRPVPEITIGQNYRAILRGYFGSVNVRNGSQYLTLTASNGLAYIDFTATAQNFGFQAGAGLELMNVSLLPN